MKDILRAIAHNLLGAPAAVPLPERVPTPDGFHGRVLLDATRCIGCGMCAYVCVSNAITGQDQGGAYLWRYDPARCAFDARCVERCPANALSMSGEPVPSYAHPGELAVSVRVQFPPCPGCGTPTRPAPPELVALAFAHISDEDRDRLSHCERCRRKVLQRKLIAETEEVES